MLERVETMEPKGVKALADHPLHAGTLGIMIARTTALVAAVHTSPPYMTGIQEAADEEDVDEEVWAQEDRG